MLKENRLFPISIAGLAILSSWAAASPDSTLGNSFIDSFSQLLIYIFTLLIITFIICRKEFARRNIIIAFAPILYWLIYLFDSSLTVSLQITNLVILVCFSLADGEVKSKAFSIYRKFLVLVSVIGIICFISNYIGVSILPFRIVDFYDGMGYGQYIDYRVCYILDTGVSFRLCGLFNEPGYLGTILSLVLCVEKINIKKWDNFCMFIAGIFTFSLAFYLIIISYLIFTSLRNFWRFIFVLLIIIFLVSLITLLIEDIQNDAIRILLRRFTFNNGEWLGDSRTGGMVDTYYKNLINSGHALWGYGTGFTSTSMFEPTSTFKQYVVNYGYLGAGLMWGYLFFSSFVYLHRKNIVLSFVICFFCSIYQRPQIFNIVYFLILFGGIDIIISSKKANYYNSF